MEFPLVATGGCHSGPDSGEEYRHIRGIFFRLGVHSVEESFEQFLKIALQSQAICRRYGVPIIINDRIDIALAINADGVHLGQTDMPVSIARSLLPKGSIIGVSCNTSVHVETAVKNGVDYVGVGAVWGTATKALTSPIIGVRGVGEMLKSLDGCKVKAVAIGNCILTFYCMNTRLQPSTGHRRHKIHKRPPYSSWLCLNHRP